jgi:very-short-patch-repair endonuclease
MTYLVEVLGVSHPVPVSGTRAQRMAAIAGLQRGRIARRQLLAAGVDRGAIGRLIANGHLHRRHPAVYAVGHAAPVPLGDETAALLACGPGAVLSHTSAAILWGLISEDRGDGLIHVTVHGRHGAGPHGVVVHRTSRLDRSATRIHRGLPVTSPARTLLDIAEILPQAELDWAVDEAITQTLVSHQELQRLVRSARGRRGAARLGRAVARHTGPSVSKSRAERRLREIVRAAALPEPLTNARVHGCAVDAYWPEHGLVVEVDGYKFHRTRPKLERDSAKGAKLVAMGLAVMRFTWPQMQDTPLVVAARLAQALARAEARRTAG